MQAVNAVNDGCGARPFAARPQIQSTEEAPAASI